MSLDVDLARELAQARQDADEDRFAEIDPRLLTWLALLPEWTDRLAAALGGPWVEVDTGAVLDELESRSLIERRQALAADGSVIEAFWLRSGLRSSLGAHLRTTLPDFEHCIDELSSALGGLGPTAGAGLATWTHARTALDPSGARLLAQVDTVIKEESIADAFQLVAAARCIGDLLGGAEADAARRAQWRIDRAYRESRDAHYLEYYYPRRDIEAAITELIDGTDEHWVLHLRGDGGVGKTMLVRYLASGAYARKHERVPFPVARVDFDNLDARFPEQRPAELLMALAQELIGFASSRSGEQWYRRFQDAADRLHEELARRAPDPATVDDLLDKVVIPFARFLGELAPRVPGEPDVPVVLVLDTCEELAKLYVPGSKSPAIERTFDMLQRLKRAFEPLRVLLAGRRSLVRSAGGAEPAGPVLSEWPFVRVLEVEGFDAGDASGYLAARVRARSEHGPSATRIHPDVLDAILRRAAVGSRYNPFELTSYVEWALRDPKVTAQLLLASPGDPYVQHRIIGRLADVDLRVALPIAAELGRFDVELISGSLRRVGLQPERVFDLLAAEEWMNTVDVTADGRPKVIEVNERLRERLRAYTAADRREFPLDPASIGLDAATLVRRTEPIARVMPATVDAAIRLQPVEQAGWLWADFESLVVAQGAWATAGTVAALVGPTEVGRAEFAGPTILAAIKATQAAARLHNDDWQGVGELWANVEELAPRHPDPELARVLRARAVCGRAAWTASPPSSAVAEALESVGRGTPPDAALAALERLGAAFSPRATDVLCRSENSAIRAASLMLRAWMLLDSADADQALRNAEDAVAAAAEAEAGASPTADWKAPRRLVDRCRALQIHTWAVTGQKASPAFAVPWRAEAARHSGDIDAERMLACLLDLDLAWAPVPEADLDALQTASNYVRGRLPTAWIHRRIEPLVIHVARGWSALGLPMRAAAVLRAAREAAVSAGDDPDTVEACDLELVRLCRRYRTGSFAALRELARSSARAELRLEAALTLGLLQGFQRDDTAEVLRRTASGPRTDDPCPRHAGLALLDQGELLAVYRPGAAVPILQAAEASLRRADDELAADQASVLSVLASGRAGLEPPEWGGAAALQQLAQSDHPAATGWAERLRVAEAWAAGAPVEAAGDSPELRPVLPLPAWAASAYPGPPVMAEPPASVESPSRLARCVLTVAALVLLIVVPILARAQFSGFADVASYLVGALVILVIIAGIARIVAAMLAAARSALSGRVHFFSPRAWTLHVHADAGGQVAVTRSSHLGTLELDPPPVAFLRNLILDQLDRLEDGVEIDLSQPVPGQLSRSAPHLSRRPRRLWLTILQLEVDAGVEHHPWEQWFGHAAPAASNVSQMWFRREQGRSRTAPWATSGWPSSIRRSRAWSAAPSVYRGPRHLAPRPEIVARARPSSGSEQTSCRVLHLVGAPVSTAAGWRLRILDDDLPTSAESTRGTRVGEVLRGPDDLPAAGSIVVLQAQPVDTSAQTFSTDRPGFLGSARSLLDAGADAVLIVPPLPDAAAAAAVAKVWRRIAIPRRPPTRADLLRLQADLKAIVASAEGRQRDPESERPVLDTLLIMPTFDRRRGKAAGASTI